MKDKRDTRLSTKGKKLRGRMRTIYAHIKSSGKRKQARRDARRKD